MGSSGGLVALDLHICAASRAQCLLTQLTGTQNSLMYAEAEPTIKACASKTILKEIRSATGNQCLSLMLSLVYICDSALLIGY